MSQGPQPVAWSETLTGRGLWRQTLLDEMQKYSHQVGLKIVRETMPQKRNRVTLADQKDQYGLPVARFTYSLCDNDKRLVKHSLDYMSMAMHACGRRARCLASDRRYVSSERHGAHGRRSGNKRRQRRLPKLGHRQSMDLRWFRVSDRWQRKSILDHSGDRHANRRSHRSACCAR